jgi:sugar lactone lactonase YvrE
MAGDLYLLTGESEGILARKILRLTGSGNPPQVVADFLAFAKTAEPDIFDEVNVFSNPYSMIPDPEQRRFLVTDGATGWVLAVGLDGRIQVFSEVEGHEVLTGIVGGPDGAPYVTSFSQLPHATGDGAVLRLDPDGTFDVAIDGLTTPIDVAFDSEGRLYVLEFLNGTETGRPYQGETGRLLRFAPQGEGWGTAQALVEELPFPTALLIDAEDRIYVSVHGAFSSPMSGVVVRFDHLAERAPGQPPLRF